MKKRSSSESGAGKLRMFIGLSLLLIGGSLALASITYTLVPGTAVLLTAATTSSGGGGNGGNTSSASNATNIFSPASYVDYHEVGGEPTTVVDRYLFGQGAMPSCALLGTVSGTNLNCQTQAACPTGQLTCY